VSDADLFYNKREQVKIVKKPLSGVITAVITPFDAKGGVDYKAAETIVKFLIKKGVDALFPVGTTGEMFKLSEDERKKLAETVVKTAGGKVPVCIHVGAMDQATSVRLAQHAEKIGADFIACVTPAYFTATPREIEEYFTAVAKSVGKDFPMYLYNIPQLSTNMLTADIVKQVVARCKNVIGVKYSNSDMLLTYNYILTKKGFSVLQGTDRCFLPALFMGCGGTVSGISCVYPEPYVKVYEHYRKGDFSAAEKYQIIANEYCNILRCGSNMAYFKAALEYRGLPGGHMRPPHLDLDKAEKREFIAGLKALDEKYSELFE